ncbi:hypothetical protein [Nocardia seriolae]|uniref:hypothetical protein n=1 Tax=Nocardia seriolae TaxID=37332 RepID=UPI000909ECC0|nr:hypothetical protein [Nocardia seriolae]MTJ60127.1 hypothetical protein [Nocardia seriolae]MTJ76257.1 hypothetical protein [Nocardia seriolae]MTJ85126.1 hypothetical protein [Nocardia seriolae]MTK29120.1 hypothetical protein [Nocardia seriolae]MTK38058.1 hypothetical protein [Nocardia seriolae]
MSAPGACVTRNAKAVVSAIGGIINVLAVSVALFQFAPPQYAGVGTALLAVMEALRSTNVWIVKNEPAIAATVDKLATEAV